MPADSDGARLDSGPVVDVEILRSPKAVLWRALLGGVAAGGLLGALVVLPDSLEAQLAPEPDTAYPVTWSVLLVAVPIGALVGFLSALLALVVWEWQVSWGARRARVAGSATAALAVLALAVGFSVVTSAPGSVAWTVSGLAFLTGAALVSFALAYLSIPGITTTKRGSRSGGRAG